MKILGLAFSSRKAGNSSKMLYYCLSKLKHNMHETELIHVHDLDMNPCGKCNYECCKKEDCPIHDDLPALFAKCLDADLLLFALPTYCGHLPSTYFMFSERSQALLANETIYEEGILKKVNFIFIGNIIAGADMSSHEALYSFAGKSFFPETILISSRDYNRKPINGDLIELEQVQDKLERFVDRLLQK
ncbi:flavodoxin family protein [Niallia sp. 03133]|uniref:flavodoxin family protein n=1 Tax=Niallia sp. 03133 TaxID=3458060 RepID=UPI004043B4B0